MRVLLAFPPTLNSQYARGFNNYPPLAIYQLAAVLERNGFEAGLLDPVWFVDNLPEGPETLAEGVLKDAGAVGISAHSFNWPQAQRLAQRIKALRPELPVIIGGVHGTHFDRHILSTSSAEFVVRGEGEVILIELLRALETGRGDFSGIAGLSYRDRQGEIHRNPDAPLLTEEELRQLALPLLNRVPPGRYYAPLIETSRGCLYSCTFCGIMHQKSWRGLDAAGAVDRLRRTLSDARGLYHLDNYTVFVDDCFTRDEARMTGVLQGIRETVPQARFAVEGRITDLRKPAVREAIPLAQVDRFLIGIESGYNEGLKRIRKGFKVEQVEEILDEIGSSDLAKSLLCAFVIGFPWEGEEECLATIRFAAKLVRTYDVQCRISWYAIVPSAIWEERKQLGVDLDETFFDEPNWFMLPSDNRGRKENFYAVRPKLTESIYQRIDDSIAAYRRVGIELCETQ